MAKVEIFGFELAIPSIQFQRRRTQWAGHASRKSLMFGGLAFGDSWEIMWQGVEGIAKFCVGQLGIYVVLGRWPGWLRGTRMSNVLWALCS